MRPCILSGVSAPHFSCHFGSSVEVFQFQVSDFKNRVLASVFKVKIPGLELRIQSLAFIPERAKNQKQLEPGDT